MEVREPFVHRRTGGRLSCRTSGALSCRRCRENPKGEGRGGRCRAKTEFSVPAGPRGLDHARRDLAAAAFRGSRVAPVPPFMANGRSKLRPLAMHNGDGFVAMVSGRGDLIEVALPVLRTIPK